MNGKISELNAALGLSILTYIDEIIAKRKLISDTYSDELGGSILRRLKVREGTESSYSYYPVIFPTQQALLKTVQALNDKEIFPRRYFYPSLNKLPYVNYVEMPVAESISERILCLPLYADLRREDSEMICRLVKESL